jgi:exosome complex exonuclease DIS3/RRP44
MAPPNNRSFVKKTKAGRVMKVVREHYLRDDIYVGSELAAPEFRGPDPSSWKLAKDASAYVVVDTNVALHQMDLLAHACVTDVVVPSVVLEECRARSRPSYERLRALCQDPTKRFFVFANEHHRDTYVKADVGESPNDRNDRAIRVVCKFYQRAVPGMRVVLLTNDRGNLKKARDEGVDAVSCREFAKRATAADSGNAKDAKGLADLVAPSALDEEEDDGVGDGGSRAALKRARGDADADADGADGENKRSSKHKPSRDDRSSSFVAFAEHLSPASVAAGVAGGSLHQGALRTTRHSPWEGSIACDALGCDIRISGRDAMNRAMDGDVVAVALLPESEWRAPSALLPGAGADNEDAETVDVSLAPRVADEEGALRDAGSGKGARSTNVEGRSSESSKKDATPSGVVVSVVKRAWRERGYASSLDVGPGASGAAGRRAAADTSANPKPARVLVVPVDRRLPKIRVVTRQAPSIADQRIVVAIDDWPRDSLYPVGHYVKSLGPIGDADAETAAVLLEADVDDRPFAPAVHACVPPLPWRFEESEHLGPIPKLRREDHRALRVCSVDPPGCRDIDDALSCRVIETLDGDSNAPKTFELGVHIADVTSFLKPNTAMDDEARRRGTTTYLVNKRLDMLPKPLTEDICSLRGGTERLTFSVFFKFDATTGLPVPDAQPRFTKAVIRSDAALTYQEAQAMMDDPDDVSDLAKDLRNINFCAKALRKRRVAAGALSLASPEVKFELDKTTSDPLDVGMYVTREANRMVEEMMLLANVASAEAILKAFPSQAMLRRHPAPAPRMFDPLLKSCAAAGVKMDVTSSKALADSLDAATRPDDAYFNTLLRIVATRCMSQAVYCVSGAAKGRGRSDSAPNGETSLSHYGLAAPLYTHFTSPIRRYADVVVHRLLNAALGLEPLDGSFENADALRETADNVNVRHRNSQGAGRASVELHTHIFFKKKPVERCEARVVRVKANGVVVFVPKFGIEAPLVFDSAADFCATEEDKKKTKNACVFDEDAMRVTDPSGKTWQIFDRLHVRIEIEELPARRSRLAIRAVD